MDETMRSVKEPAALERLQKIWLLLFVFGDFVFLYFRTFWGFATPFVTVGDQSLHYLNALRILHGQLPLRDFFIFVSPGTDLLYAGILHLLGVHQWVFQGTLIVLGLSLSLTVVWLSSSVLRGPKMILPGILFLVFDFNSALDATHHWWSVLFIMVATGLLLGGRTYRRIFAAGVLCGVSALFTQTHGLLCFGAFSLYLFWTDRSSLREAFLGRNLFLFFSSFSIVVIPFVGHYIRLVGIRSFFFWMVYYPLKYFSGPRDNPLAFFEAPTYNAPSDLLFLIPIHVVVPLVYLLCMIRLVRERGRLQCRERKRILLLVLVGLALFAAVMNAPTFLRLCVVAPPALILFVWFLDRPARSFRWMNLALWTVALALSAYLPLTRQLHRHATADLPTGNVAFATEKQYQRTWWLAAHTHAGDTFFDEPSTTLALGLGSPGPIDYIKPYGYTRPQHIQALISAMTADRTRYIFLYSELLEPEHPGDMLGSFRQYVAENYHLAKIVPGGEIWERN